MDDKQWTEGEIDALLIRSHAYLFMMSMAKGWEKEATEAADFLKLKHNIDIRDMEPEEIYALFIHNPEIKQ